MNLYKCYICGEAFNSVSAPQVHFAKIHKKKCKRHLLINVRDSDQEMVDVTVEGESMIVEDGPSKQETTFGFNATYSFPWEVGPPEDKYYHACINAINLEGYAYISVLIHDVRLDLSTDDYEIFVQLCKNKLFTSLVSDVLPKVDPAAQNNQAIVNAAENGAVGIVRLLLSDSRVDPSAQDNRALTLAMQNKHDEIAELLVSHIRNGSLDMDMRKIKF